MTGWGERVSISPSLPCLTIPLRPFQRTFKGRRPFRPRFLFPGDFSPSLCRRAPSAASWMLFTQERLIGLPRRLRVHPRKQGFEIAGREASGLAKPTPQPAPSLHELITPKLPRGGGCVEREPIVRGGRTPSPAQAGAASLPPFQGPAWTAAGSEWLGSEWEGLNVSPQGSRESERAETTEVHSEGISFWKSSDRAGALAWSVSSPLCRELGGDHLDSVSPKRQECLMLRARAQGGALRSSGRCGGG